MTILDRVTDLILIVGFVVAALRWATWKRRARLAAIAFYMSTTIPDDMLIRVDVTRDKPGRFWARNTGEVYSEMDLDKAGAEIHFREWLPRFWRAIKERNS